MLEQQPAQLQQGHIMGTDHTYVIPPAGEPGARRAANVRKCGSSPAAPPQRLCCPGQPSRASQQPAARSHSCGLGSQTVHGHLHGGLRAERSRVCRLEALRKEAGADMEVAIDPEELEGLDDTAVKALYEQRLAEERARHSREVSQALRPEGLFQRKVYDNIAWLWTFCRMFAGCVADC